MEASPSSLNLVSYHHFRLFGLRLFKCKIVDKLNLLSLITYFDGRTLCADLLCRKVDGRRPVARFDGLLEGLQAS